jgi:hypothetical protein
MRLVSISRGSPRGYFRAFLDWAGFADVKKIDDMKQTLHTTT